MASEAPDVRAGKLGTPTTKNDKAWVRRYPPLFSMVVAVFIGVTVLPSALNLPQSNPSTVLEYAPVPPDDDTPPSSEGSISSLGLGQSSGLSTGATQQITKTTSGGSVKKPRIKDCVQFEDGLKQSSDPNAPPCVPFFDGDNGGETWQGVTGDEIRLLVYTSASITVGGADNSGSSPSGGSYCDLDEPPDTSTPCLDGDTQSKDHYRVRVARAMTRYFNERFQTYGRRVHTWVYYANSSATASSRRSDAADNWEKIKPFAVIDQAFFGGFNAAYAEAMVRRKVMVFGSFTALENAYYRKNAPMIWAFWPDVEHAADIFVSYICAKVAPFGVSHPQPGRSKYKDQREIAVGDTRRVAFFYTSDPSFPGLRSFAELAKAGIKACPGSKLNIVLDEVTFPRATYATDTHPSAIRAARDNVALMKDRDITTIIWLGGMEGGHTAEAKVHDFYPEWIVAGDNFIETMENGRAQDQDVWRNAWGITNLLREGNANEVPARRAYREAEPSGPDSDEDEAASVYRDYFLVFKSIQVAGPRLTPQSVDAGAHAIPRVRSYNPYVAACYYDAGDFSCVKDAAELYWDSDAPDPDNDPDQRGCWRLVNGGVRYVAGSWPGKDEAFVNTPANPAPCSTVNYGTFINPYGPRG